MYLKTKTDFDAAVGATVDGSKPLVIEFEAEGSLLCKKIGPVYETIVANYPELTLKKIDVDSNAEAAQAANIEIHPTFKVYMNGTEVNEMRGNSEAGLVNLLN